MSHGNQTCPVCGTTNEVTAVFCQECGARLEAPPAPSEPAVPAPTASSWTSPTADAAAPETAADRRRPAHADSPPSHPSPGTSLQQPAASPSRATKRAFSPAPDPPVPFGRVTSQAADGNWLTTAPPQAVVVVGLILSLGACWVLTLGQDGLREPLEPILFCVAPIGMLLALVGLVRLVTNQRRQG